MGQTKMGNTSLEYFGQSTTSAGATSEQNRKGVLDGLLRTYAGEGDPLCSDRPTVMDLLNEDADIRAQTLLPPLLLSVSSVSEPVSATPTLCPRSPASGPTATPRS